MTKSKPTSAIRRFNKYENDPKHKDMKEIEPTSTVRIYKRDKREGNWKQKGKLISKRKEPRSYNVLNEKRDIIRRNRSQLMPTNEVFESNTEYESDEEVSDNKAGTASDTTDTAKRDTQNVVSDGNEYITRYGRVCRQPDRFGY